MKAAYSKGALVLLVLLAVPPDALRGQTVVSHDEVSQDLVIRDLTVRDGVVNGMLVNLSPHPLGEVRMLIRQTFLWKRERAPGKVEENPSRSFYYNLPDTISPGGVVSFTVRPRRALPHRKDGKFETYVEIIGYKDLSEGEFFETQAGGEGEEQAVEAPPTETLEAPEEK